jgi:xanthine dehydrogenase iron-sulfur cluster and FAD-binding subunit A
MWQTYYSPTSVSEALRLLAKYGPECRIVAGGTDLLVELRRGIRRAPVLIDVTRTSTPGGMDRIHLDDEGLIHIGPLVTHNQAVASQLLVKQGFPLALSCWEVGTPQLRNRGTIAGNLVTASPANDTITTLWALDARLTLSSVRGEHTLSFDDFYYGVRKTALASDEMVTHIMFPALQPGQRGIFVKLGLRRSHAIAVVNAAAVLTFDGDRVSRARITLGSVAPTIIRAPEAETALAGETLAQETIARAANLAAQAAAPIDDIRGGAKYRREMVRVLVGRALNSLRDGTERAKLPSTWPMLWGQENGRFQPLIGEAIVHRSDGDMPIECTVNGRRVVVQGASDKTLLDMLREDLGLTGAKEGCAEGECGACTVWMDGVALLGCLVPAPRAHGTHITTVEGLARADELHPVQQAFIDEGAVQCGYCTPGFVMSGAKLLEEIPKPTHEQIIGGLHGNLCRCTGYYKIVRAIEKAAEGNEGDWRQTHDQ